MKYNYDVADFKVYLFNKNPRYRVDGLTFWQNRIPLPIDLFNRIFDDGDEIFAEYIRQLTAAIIVLSEQKSFEQLFTIKATQLPNKDLLKQKAELIKWLDSILEQNKSYQYFMLNIAETFNFQGLTVDAEKIATSLCHQGKKYARLAFPEAIRQFIAEFPLTEQLGADNTDMFGNIIADRYDIYRSGFSDALAIIFNALIEFRLLCSGHKSNIHRINLSVEKSEEITVVTERTIDGSLWEPGYTDDHLVKINPEHPFIKTLESHNSKHLTEFLYYLSEFENNQFSDTQRKIIENMRQEVSRTLWIKHD